MAEDIKTSRWQVIKWWFCWVILDMIPKSWAVTYDTKRYKIFQRCFDGFEQYVYWYAKRWK